MAEETPARSRIFISYRRDDAAGHVLALIPPLRQRFGASRIFKDTDNIAPGQDFVNVIQRELETCAVLVAVIGRDWLTVQDPRLKCRRVDSPNDYLRLEVATALKNERVLVIPALVDRATMPAPDDLPPDLQSLARRNAVELSDQRWDSDVERLLQAIERACAQPSANRFGRPEKDPESQSGTAWDRRLLESRRKREIAQHVAAATAALEAGDPQSALQSCEKAAWLDPNDPDSRELASRARKMLDQRRIDGWLADARRKLDQGDLGGASELIDQALLLNSSYQPAMTLREQLLRGRRNREREGERARLVQAALDRARAFLNGGDFNGAIQSADDALALAADCAEAIAVRATAVAASEDARRAKEAKEDSGRAQGAVIEARETFAAEAVARREQQKREEDEDRRVRQAVDEAWRAFAAGDHKASLASLEAFGQSHQLVSQTLHEMRVKLDALERARQEQEQRQQDAQRALLWSPITTVTGPARFTLQAWGSAAVLIATLGLGTWFALKPGRPSAVVADNRQVEAPPKPASGAQTTSAGKDVSLSGQTAQNDPATTVAPTQVETAAQGAGRPDPNADRPTTESAVTLGTKDPAQLGRLKALARKQQQAGERELARSTVAQGLDIDPKDATLLSIQSALLREAEASAVRTRRAATEFDAENWAPEQFRQALEQESNAVKLRRSGAVDAATRSFLAAAAQFQTAARESRVAEAASAEKPAASEPTLNAPRAAPPVVDQAADQAADQLGVLRTLRRYETAYASLSVDAVRSVFPSAPVSQLEAEFAGYGSYTLKIEVEESTFLRTPTITLATVRGHVYQDMQSKSGRRVQTDRFQTFKLQKQGQGWIIALIQ